MRKPTYQPAPGSTGHLPPEERDALIEARLQRRAAKEKARSGSVEPPTPPPARPLHGRGRK